jgi:hypothetical protein
MGRHSGAKPVGGGGSCFCSPWKGKVLWLGRCWAKGCRMLGSNGTRDWTGVVGEKEERFGLHLVWAKIEGMNRILVFKFIR